MYRLDEAFCRRFGPAMPATPAFRARLFAWLEPPKGRPLNAAGWAIIGLVIASLVAMALETEATRTDTILPAGFGDWVSLFNAAVVVIFAAEYVARLWACVHDPRFAGLSPNQARWAHASSPLALADLAAFLPELLVMLFFGHLGGAWLAALRALRLFRLIKLARYVPAFAIVGRVLQRASAPLLAALAVAATQIYVAALALYLIEGDIPGQEASFGSITRSLWWAVVTLTTVGYGDVYPITVWGKVAAAFIALAGIGIVAMPAGIIASSFAEEYRAHHESEQEARLKALERRDREFEGEIEALEQKDVVIEAEIDALTAARDPHAAAGSAAAGAVAATVASALPNTNSGSSSLP
jgi:voltage-gated potassium channel